VANARVGSSELVIDIPERVAARIRDHAVIIYDDAVRSTKIARRLNLMKRLSELLVCNAEPVTDALTLLVGFSGRFQITRAITGVIALARD
jgi:hypothetical protein